MKFEIDINKYLDEEYIRKLVRKKFMFDGNEIKVPVMLTSNERMKYIEKIQNDPIIIDYMSSDIYKNKQVKKKSSFLSENDPTLQKIDYIATYLLQPDFKSANIRANSHMKEMGQIRSKSTGKRIYFKRIIFLEQVADRYNKNANEDETFTSEELATVLTNLNDTSPLWDVFDPTNYKHIRKYLKSYSDIVTIIDNTPDSRLWSLVTYVNELINNINLNDIEKDIMFLLQQGSFSYGEIKDIINQKHNKNYSYQTIKDKVYIYFPLKISKKIRKQIKKMNEKTLL